MDATFVQAARDGRVSAGAGEIAQRAALDAFLALWLPRVHRFAHARLRDRGATEAATRATLEAVVRAGLVGARGDLAAAVLALAKAEIARQRALAASA